jgi:hypothetical protein
MVVIVMRYCFRDLCSGKLALVLGVQYICARDGIVHKFSYSLLVAAGHEIRPALCFSTHDDNGFMVVMVVAVVPSVVLINGKGGERRTQQRHTEQ